MQNRKKDRATAELDVLILEQVTRQPEEVVPPFWSVLWEAERDKESLKQHIESYRAAMLAVYTLAEAAPAKA